MRLLERRAMVTVCLGVFLALSGRQAELQGRQRGDGAGRGQGGGAGQGRMDVWAPMPVKPNPFVPPNKPLTKLSDLLAKHKSEQNWTETVVSDHLFHGDYIAMGPGAKTPRRFHQDNRAFWIVQDGQIRFTIEGQEPFVASKGFLVQVPNASSTAWKRSETDRRCGSR